MRQIIGIGLLVGHCDMVCPLTEHVANNLELMHGTLPAGQMCCHQPSWVSGHTGGPLLLKTAHKSMASLGTACCASWASRRPDVLPPAIMGELARLQDRIAPFDTSEARQVVEAELRRPIDEVFSEFSTMPVAAASLAQARLRVLARHHCPLTVTR